MNKLNAGFQQQQLLFAKAVKEAEAAIEVSFKEACHSAKKTPPKTFTDGNVVKVVLTRS